MESIITKQQATLNGNEAYLIGVDKIGQQIWLEVLNSLEIKCEVLQHDNHNLNHTLNKKVFGITDGNYLSSLFNKYSMLNKYMNRQDAEAKQVMKIVIKDILDIVKPT